MEKTTFKHMVQPWARKWQSPFLIIFKNKVETEILSQSELKPLVLKRFIAFYRRHILALNYKQRQNRTCEQSSFTAEISDKETTFLDTYIYKGARFERNAILDLRTHFKPTETFQYTHFKSCPSRK